MCVSLKIYSGCELSYIVVFFARCVWWRIIDISFSMCTQSCYHLPFLILFFLILLLLLLLFCLLITVVVNVSPIIIHLLPTHPLLPCLL
jgi:hypothetical protein